MDFLNKAYGQLAELFRSMTPGARITTALLLAVIVTSLTYLFRYQTDRAEEYLFNGEALTQGEIVAIEAAFGKAGLNDYEIAGNKIRVPRAQRAKYLDAIGKENALPQSFGSALRGMFHSDSPFDTRDIRERKALFAKENELSYTIRKMMDIEVADVKIDEQPPATFGGRKIRQALVSVKSLGNKTLDDEQVKTIRYTVASGAGVKPADVTVTDLNGQTYPGVGQEQGVSEFHNLYATYQRTYVNDYKRRIVDRLSTYPGIKVAVNVELDKDLENQTSSFKYDDKPTSIQTSTQTKESNSNAGPPAGRPGAVPNGAVGNAPAQVAASTSSESTLNESREDLKSVVGATQTTTQKAPLVPVWVSASIGVPSSYFVTIWHLRNPTAPGDPPKTPLVEQLKEIETEKLREIEEAVVNLLPRPPKGDDLYKPVKVMPYDEAPLPELESPSIAANAFDWFAENWQTLGLFGLAAFGVIFLRGMVRAAQAAVPPSSSAENGLAAGASSLDSDDSAASPEVTEAVANSLKRKFQGSGRGLREELTELVREDPDSAANVLKLWISDAA